MSTRTPTWRVPLLLLALSAVPMLGGLARLLSLSSGVVTEANARFFAQPVATVMHVLVATAYCVLGAFQFSTGFRVRWPRWHRLAGRVAAVCGFTSALTGVWMAARPDIPADMQGPLLLATRLVVGVAMAAALVLWVRAILRRDVRSHEAWMIRAYALGQGAGMQAVLMLPSILMLGDVLGPTRDVFMAFAWALNALLAELVIRSTPASAVSRRPARVGG